jgi:hypothetical protein
MLVPVLVQGDSHLVYAALQSEVEAKGYEVVYAQTLCGLPCGYKPLTHNQEARHLPPCPACVAEDERRYPDGANKRVLR